MRELSIFPLHTVLFPGTPLPLHIFEPRYRLMIHDAIQHNTPFGVVLIKQGVEALGPLPEPHLVGCTANIAKVEHLPDGRMNLLAIGEERFRILTLDRSGPFLRAKVEILPMEEPQTLSVTREVKHLRPWIRAYLKILKEVASETLPLEMFTLPHDSLPLLYIAASLLQIPLIEKQDLLEAETSAHLLSKLKRLYRREVTLLWHLHTSSEAKAKHTFRLN
ncbi:LON peptidase substrate-binding domain-containing protein [uncultured Thermanaerothrix sp.]|uniref:LON peptidase substrate-binding domain-containing protein n=1 Tax=uncultured Thermanaerothrix sp. TaxID=1195149 RepID=UPI00261086E2|nr:LON peptidase substrate-binding domain-containing protein [uncultured Thermanaerothrix sp.]